MHMFSYQKLENEDKGYTCIKDTLANSQLMQIVWFGGGFIAVWQLRITPLACKANTPESLNWCFDIAVEADTLGTTNNGGGRVVYFTVEQRLTNHIAKPFNLCDMTMYTTKMRNDSSELCSE